MPAHSLVDGLATVTQHEVDKARGFLRDLVDAQILLHPDSDGAERFLTTVLSGDYSGLVRLAVSSTDANDELKTAKVFMRRRQLR